MNQQDLINFELNKVSESIAKLALESRKEGISRKYCKKLIQLARQIKNSYNHHHNWGDWPDELFSQVDNAASDIGLFCRKWGRIGVTQFKEKYGNCRCYCSFGCHQLFSITHPGYAFSRYPKWLWTIDCLYISKLFRFIRLDKIIVPYQIWIYRLAYTRACEKYPLIREEILEGADYHELLQPLYKKYGIETSWQRLNSQTGKWEKIF